MEENSASGLKILSLPFGFTPGDNVNCDIVVTNVMFKKSKTMTRD